MPYMRKTYKTERRKYRSAFSELVNVQLKFALHIKSQDKDFDDSMVRIQSLRTRNTRTEMDSEYPFSVKYMCSNYPFSIALKILNCFARNLGTLYVCTVIKPVVFSV